MEVPTQKGRPGRLGGRPRLPQRPVRVGEHLSGVAVNDLSRRGQDGPPPCALQQLQLQVPLQGVELLHHRRGREVELFRRLLKLPQSATQTKVANWGLNMAAPPFRSNFWLIPWYKIGASLSSQPGLK